MADNSTQDTGLGIKMFGFEIKRTKKEEDVEKLPAVVPPTDPDGAGYVTAAGHHYGHYIDIDGATESKDNHQLIRKYRGVAQHPETDMAIEEIVNEMVSANENKAPVELNLDNIDPEIPKNVATKIQAEFDTITKMLNFNELCHDIIRSWYVDGRLYHQLVLDNSKPKEGIQDIRYIDAAKIRKVRHVKYDIDPATKVKTVKKVDEFFIFEEKPGSNNQGVKMHADSVSYVSSGLLDESRTRVVSYLHKALKPINQLRMMEDSLVIYRLARAPERRIFYIDTGSLPKGKAEQYMKQIQTQYRNKLVYDANTGQLKDDRKHMSMLEDFWLPRREGGRGTEISTLPGGQNLGEIDDIIYFQKKLYRSLNVPINRLEQEAQFSLGRSSEITRDEVKFQKFIDRLRKRFSKLFTEILKKQLLLKQIITEEDWDLWSNDIQIDFLRDSAFSELKQAEITRERFQTLDTAQNYIGEYVSKEWVMKNILHFSADEVEEILSQIEKEGDSGEYDQPEQPAPAPPEPTPVTVVDQPKEKAANEQTDPRKYAFHDEAELNLMESVQRFLDEK